MEGSKRIFDEGTDVESQVLQETLLPSVTAEISETASNPATIDESTWIRRHSQRWFDCGTPSADSPAFSFQLAEVQICLTNRVHTARTQRNYTQPQTDQNGQVRESAGEIKLKVIRAANSGMDAATIMFATQDESTEGATAGNQYAVTSGELEFVYGQMEAVVAVQIHDEQAYHKMDSFKVQLSPNPEYTLQPNPECRVWIFDRYTVSRRLQLFYNSIAAQVAITVMALASIVLPLYQLLDIQHAAEQEVGENHGWQTMYWILTISLMARTVFKFALKRFTYRWRVLFWVDVVTLLGMLPLFDWFQQMLLPQHYGSGEAMRARIMTMTFGHVSRSLQLSMVLAHFSAITVRFVVWFGGLISLVKMPSPKETIQLTLNKCTGLEDASQQLDRCDPYVKWSVQSSQADTTRGSTSTQKDTLEPAFEEIFEFESTVAQRTPGSACEAEIELQVWLLNQHAVTDELVGTAHVSLGTAVNTTTSSLPLVGPHGIATKGVIEISVALQTIAENEKQQITEQMRKKGDAERMRLTRMASSVTSDIAAKIVLLVCLASLCSCAIAFAGIPIDETASSSYVTLPMLTKLYLRGDPFFQTYLTDFQTSYERNGYPVVYLRLNETVLIDQFEQFNTMKDWQFSAHAFDVSLAANSTSATHTIPSKCLVKKSGSLENWAQTRSDAGGCTSALVVDARSEWRDLGLKLVWFTGTLILLTVSAILFFSFDIVWVFIMPLARVGLAMSTVVELATSGWDSDGNVGWFEKHLKALLIKEQQLGDALQTLQDAMLDGERYFRLPLLPWRRMLTQAQKQMTRLQTIQKEGLELARRADAGTLVWRDVTQFKQRVDGVAQLDWCGTESFTKVFEVLQGLLKHLVLAMHVEGAFDENGEMTIKGAQRAIGVAIEKGLAASSLLAAADGGIEGQTGLPAGAVEGLLKHIKDRDIAGLCKLLDDLDLNPKVRSKIETVLSVIGEKQLHQLGDCLAQLDIKSIVELCTGSSSGSSILSPLFNRLLHADTPALDKFVSTLTDMGPSKLQAIVDAFASGSLTKLDMSSMRSLVSAALPSDWQSMAAHARELVAEKIKAQLHSAGLSPNALETLRAASVNATKGASLSTLTTATLRSLSVHTDNPVVTLALETVQGTKPTGEMIRGALLWAQTVAPPQQQQALAAAAGLAGEFHSLSGPAVQQLLDALTYVVEEGDGHANASSVTAVVQVVRGVLEQRKVGAAGNLEVLSHVVDMFGSSFPKLDIASSLETMPLGFPNQQGFSSIELLRLLDSGHGMDAVVSLVQAKLVKDGAWGKHVVNDSITSAFHWVDEFIRGAIKCEVQSGEGCAPESFMNDR